MFGVTFDCLDEVRDEVITAFKFGIDTVPLFATVVVQSNEDVVCPNKPYQGYEDYYCRNYDSGHLSVSFQLFDEIIGEPFQYSVYNIGCVFEIIGPKG